jgi:hypothetical protein
MSNAFKFNIGDNVQVNPDAAVVGGIKGQVHAIELSAHKVTVAVKFRCSRTGDRIIRVCQSQLQRVA